MDDQVNPLERDHSLSVVLPGGLEKNATVHGSKPVMDLLVTLCASYHLNPSDYTVEVLSPNKNNISFKPNSLIGSLEADTIVLKPKGTEEIKIRRPYMPEASVRLLINYNKSHKAVVRVNPRVPLEMLLPAVCNKCEFQVETTVLLRDSQSTEPLDLTKTLNEHGLREAFAKDSAAKEPTDHQHRAKTPEAAVTPTQVITPPPLHELPKKEKKQKDNTGFLSLFRRRKKTAGMDGAGSVPASPGLRVNVPGVSSSMTLPAETPKKRRAPQPPMGASTSLPNNLSSCHAGGSQMSADSTLRRPKRRAPPPPCANAHLELQADTQLKGTVDSLNTVEELRESDESSSVYLSLPPASSPRLSTSSSRRFAHLHEVAEPYLPSFRGKDLSDARCALAKVLTSSISKGTLVKRLRNSATLPKLYNGSFSMPTTPRCSNNGPFCAKPESFRTSNLATEHEREDPIQRKGMTTFKVVPSKTQKFHDPELAPDQIEVHDNPESEASPELERKTEEDPCSLDRSERKTEEDPCSLDRSERNSEEDPCSLDRSERKTKEDPCSLDRSETETPLQSPEPSSQEIQTSPPPPLDLDNQASPGSPLSEVGDIAEKQKEEDEPEPEVPSEVTLAVLSDCSDGEPTSDGQINSEECQSPTGQSESTDVDHCGSYTDEEEVVPEEEEEDNYFPPPPPPVFFNENIEAMEEKREDSTTSSPPWSQPPSSTSNGQTNGFSEDHQHESTSSMPDQPADAPKPPVKISAAPSRFAQAVAMAVQRSRLHIGGKGLGPQAPGGPHSALPSPPQSTYQYGA